MNDSPFKHHQAEVEQDWLFTFKYGHTHQYKFIRIHGTYNSARAEMFHKYNDNWTFQYSGTLKQEQELIRHSITELKV